MQDPSSDLPKPSDQLQGAPPPAAGRSRLHFSLRSKLLLAFGAIVTLTALAIGTAVSQLETMHREVRAFSSDQMPAIDRAAHISALSSALAQDTSRLAYANSQADRLAIFRAATVLYRQLAAATHDGGILVDRNLDTQVRLFGVQVDMLNHLVEERITLDLERVGRIANLFTLQERANAAIAEQLERDSADLKAGERRAIRLTELMMKSILGRTLMRARALMGLQMQVQQIVAEVAHLAQIHGPATPVQDQLVPQLKSLKKLADDYDRHGGSMPASAMRDLAALITAGETRGPDQIARLEAALVSFARRLDQLNQDDERQVRRSLLAAANEHKSLVRHLSQEQASAVHLDLALQLDVNLAALHVLHGLHARDPESVVGSEREVAGLLQSIMGRLERPDSPPLAPIIVELNRYVSPGDGALARHQAQLALDARAGQSINDILTSTRSIASSARALTDHALRTMRGKVADLEALGAQARSWLMMIGAISGGAALLIWLLVVERGLSIPLHRLIATTRALAAGRHDLAIPSSDRQDEIGAMSRALEVFKGNALDLRRMAEGLETALQREKEVNALQRQFVSMVSHEFRTPLAIIDGAAQRVSRRIGSLTPERQNEAMIKIRKAVARLIDLMESVLSLARLDAGRLELKVAPIDLQAMISEICCNQRSLSIRHRIVAEIVALDGPLDADDILLRQVFVNLLSNAVKYSPEGSAVTVRGHQDDDTVTIEVEDCGVGIPEDEISRLFQRFFRARTSAGIPGTGIGLHLTRQIVELHGGRVWARANPECGMTFTVILPRAHHQVALEEMIEAPTVQETMAPMTLASETA